MNTRPARKVATWKMIFLVASAVFATLVASVDKQSPCPPEVVQADTIPADTTLLDTLL